MRCKVRGVHGNWSVSLHLNSKVKTTFLGASYCACLLGAFCKHWGTLRVYCANVGLSISHPFPCHALSIQKSSLVKKNWNIPKKKTWSAREAPRELVLALADRQARLGGEQLRDSRPRGLCVQPRRHAHAHLLLLLWRAEDAREAPAVPFARRGRRFRISRQEQGQFAFHHLCRLSPVCREGAAGELENYTGVIVEWKKKGKKNIIFTPFLSWMFSSCLFSVVNA